MKTKGFTLIELMIVVIILAILASIAYPSYRQFVVGNAESDLQSQLMNLETDAKRWRTQRLTYSGYYPDACGASSCTSFNFPLECSGNGCQYTVSFSTTSGLVTFIALPKSTWGLSSLAQQFSLTTAGTRCTRSTTPDLTLTNACPSGSDTW